MKNSVVFMLFSAVALSGASQSVAEGSSRDSEPNIEARKAADYAPAVGMAAKILGQALNLPSAQNGPPTMGMGYGMGMGMGMGMGYYKREVEELLGRALSDDKAEALEDLHAREEEYEELETRKAADYAPAAGMAAKILGQALNLPSAQNGPPTMGMGYGMGMGMGMGTGYYRRDVVEELLGRELSDHEAGVMDYLRVRDNEYEELEARKAADYAPAAGMAAKILGQALNLPSAQNGPPTMGMGYGMGMGMGMGMGYYKRDFEELLGRELSDDEASVLEGLQARDDDELEARDGDGADYASRQLEDLFERELLEMFDDSFI
ncbi:hypothetical protein PC9H_000134 [Pleurotus ostreatus]|uniref:Uncharacterized protein n=1 Tax=Pleurotus ostreatus TaxID=5322 RepID=A0A8H7A0K4_PLEOS|nr:uncharacterized protein PC9H_000134 [Pleurotus ostreatus]KAF7439798.1 hypothetical protein PC9H_000134 [Pleurotus ostreatus]KAJ8701030.1 hypothetical protein PTI98_003997 [Pleurotus ostreatus]